MARDIRYLPRPHALVELTVRTIQRRYLLRPSTRLNQLVVGVIAHAQDETGMRLHALAVMSNHMHLLASPRDVEHMADFMCLVNANISKEIGKLHDWPGSMFERRYDSIPVADAPEDQIKRLRYILQQGTKENLVLAPSDWPGIHAVDALCEGKPLEGVWIDRTEMYAARGSGNDVDEADFEQRVELKLDPLPCWQHLDVDSYRQRVAEIVRTIEGETIQRHKQQQTAPLGADWVRQRHPHERPQPGRRSPKPRFHAVAQKVRAELVAAFREFVAAYRLAAERLAVGDTAIAFPKNCFPPRLPFVKPAKLEPG